MLHLRAAYQVFLMGALMANEKDIASDKRQRVATPSSSTGRGRENPVGDIEDLMASGACPDCLVRSMTDYRNKHYKMAERTQLTAQLRNGKVSLDTVGKLFQEDGKPYWDYAAYYNAGYAGQSCAVFIANARNKTLETIQCPLVATESNPQEACAARFRERFPTKWKPGSSLRYPFQWLLWFLLR